MTKTRSTKRTLLMSALSLLLCISMLIGSTFAWFTDSVTSGNNKVQSGNLDVNLYHSSYWNSVENNEWGLGIGYFAGEEVNENTQLFLNADNKEILWEPGATAYENFRIENNGTLALKYQFKLQVKDVTKTDAGNDLTEVIKLSIDKFTYAENGVTEGKTVVENGNLEENGMLEGSLEPGETYDFGVQLYWKPSANDNLYNVKDGLSIDFGVTLVATQMTAEVDGYDNQYDKDATYPIPVLNAEDFDAAIEKGGVINLDEDVELEQGIILPESAIINLNENKLEVPFINISNEVDFIGGTLAAGTDGDYAVINRENAKATFENVDINAVGGGIAVTNGAKATFNGGSIKIVGNTTNPRYNFYVVNAGSELIINDGEFEFASKSLKRAYIYAGAGTTVYVNGGTFGVASTRDGYAAGIMGEGAVIITGGTFGFDPTNWVAEGYTATKNGSTWTVVAQ